MKIEVKVTNGERRVCLSCLSFSSQKRRKINDDAKEEKNGK